MWKALDRIVSAIIRRLFKPKYHVEAAHRQVVRSTGRRTGGRAPAHLLHRRRAPVR